MPDRSIGREDPCYKGQVTGSRLAPIIALVVVLGGCGDSQGPQTPSTPTPTTPAPSGADFPSGSPVSVVSGESGAGVAGARITIGGMEKTTSASGTVTLDRDFNAGALVDITAPGFLTRQTRLREGVEPRFTLMPTGGASGITEDFIFDVMYHDSTGDTRHMMRIRPDTAMVYFVPTDQIRNDPRAIATVRDAVSELNEIVQGESTFFVENQAPAGSVSFDLIIDPNELPDGVIGQARRDFSGWNIVGGTVIFDSLETARSSATHHELGHMVGLGHSDSRADVMFPFQRRTVETFAPRERLGVRLINQRPPFNQQPDNDRPAGNARTQATIWSDQTLCYR